MTDKEKIATLWQLFREAEQRSKTEPMYHLQQRLFGQRVAYREAIRVMNGHQPARNQTKTKRPIACNQKHT